jgi:AraC-like DNA-binding protein
MSCPADLPAVSVDVLSELLDAVRPSLAVLCHRELPAPWGPQSVRPVFDGKPVFFYVVSGGRCSITLTRGDAVRLGAGDVAVLPYGDPHLLAPDDDGQPPPRLVAGQLTCDRIMLDPLLRVLPPLLHVAAPAGSGSGSQAALIGCHLVASAPLAASAPLVASAQQTSPGSGCLQARFAELLFMEVLRRHMAGLPSQAIGWMRALNDPAVGPALQLLHARPMNRWTVDDLARQVGTSRSLLGARFKARLGQPPMRYLAGCRMRMAARLLRDGVPGVAAVAARVGYDSEPAFNRAFKRFSGVPPARWRDDARPCDRPADLA